MDIAVYVTAALGGIMLIFAGAFSSGGHRDWSIWASCLSAILFVLSAFCWYQDKVWTQDAAKDAGAKVASDAGPYEPLLKVLGVKLVDTEAGKQCKVVIKNASPVKAVTKREAIRMSPQSFGLDKIAYAVHSRGNDDQYRRNEFVAGGQLFEPNETLELNVGDPVTEETMGLANDRMVNLYAVGKIYYARTQSDRGEYEVGFCYLWDGKQFVPCAFGNFEK